MRVRLALIPLVAAALLAGCAAKTDSAAPATTTAPAGNGVAALSADEILAKAKTALAAAKSFHVKGEETSSGSKTKVDLKFSGKDFSGTVEAEGLTLELLSIGNDLYLKAPDAFFASLIPASQQSALAAIKGKYVKVDSTNAAFSGLKDTFKTDDMIKPEGTLSKGTAKTVNGVPAIGLVDSKDKSILYVATEGEPYPVRKEGGDGTTQAIDFTEFNATVDLKAPAAADVFDLKSVMGG
jgi:hypothetical protein